MERLKMDNEGIEEIKKEIDEIQKKLEDIRKYKGEVAIYQGDNWHDNPVLYSTEAKEMELMRQLNDMKQQLKNVQIVEKSSNECIVEIGDVINIVMLSADKNSKEMIIKLVGHFPKLDAEIREISVNSPLGSSIYKKNIGDNVSYKVGENQFNVVILEKLKLEANNEKSKIK